MKDVFMNNNLISDDGKNGEVIKNDSVKYKNSTWDDFYSYGVMYKSIVERSFKRKEVFTPVIIYNMSATAIEKLIMGVSILNGTLPFCHTLSGLAEFSKNTLRFDEQLVNDMNIMDSMQMICSEDDISSKVPGIEDVPFFVDVMKRIYQKTELYLKSVE